MLSICLSVTFLQMTTVYSEVLAKLQLQSGRVHIL